MSLIQCLTSISLAAVTLSTLYAEPGCPKNVDSLTLRVVQSSLIVVPVQINHSGPYDFLVDTGAEVTTVDSSLASDLRLEPKGTTGVDGVATHARHTFASLDLVQAGTHSVADSLVVIEDLAQLKAADPRIRGILGENFLGHFDMLIDNRQHILCLDDSNTLAAAVKGEHLALAEPRGSQVDLPFTRPLIVAAKLSALDPTPVLLRLDSGSNAALLYSENSRIRKGSITPASRLKSVVNGTEQAFAVLPPQDIQVGKRAVHQVVFVMPMNVVGNGVTPREDGLLPTMAFQRVFISYEARYATLEPW